MRSFIFSGIAALCLCTCAVGQETSFTVSGGYSNIQISHTAGLFYGRDGGYIEGEFLWHVPNSAPLPLLLGGSLSGSNYYDSHRIGVTFPDGTPGVARLESDLETVSIEARAAFPLSLRRQGGQGFFLVPKIGAGLLIDDYAIDHATTSAGTTYLSTSYHDGAAFDVRPGLQGGYSWGWGSIGAEVSYMAAFGDFGRLGSIAQEVRAGVFLRFRY